MSGDHPEVHPLEGYIRQRLTRKKLLLMQLSRYAICKLLAMGRNGL